MDLDHSANCERRLFNRACTCDAAERAVAEQERDSLLAENDGVMPLASERARNAPTEVPAAATDLPTNLASAVADATAKLTGQGLTAEEALRVIERRIRG